MKHAYKQRERRNRKIQKSPAVALLHDGTQFHVIAQPSMENMTQWSAEAHYPSLLFCALISDHAFSILVLHSHPHCSLLFDFWTISTH